MENKVPKDIYDKISKHNFSTDCIEVIDTNKELDLKPERDSFRIIMSLKRMNHVRHPNKFHEKINSILSVGDIYISCGETLSERKSRKLNSIIFGFKNIFLFFDFLYKRVFPKLPIIKSIYSLIISRQNNSMSKTEILGRVISSGFDVLEYFEYENLLYIISKKVQEPSFDKNASYGIIFKMNRVGYNGKTIGFYKFRTMHPYAEYCQELIDKENKLSDSGKFQNDFRVTYWGKFLRKFWIDELPMLFNFIKRDLNLVGVRPLSEGYFLKYPDDLQKLRIQVKPGLVPPYYADMPKNFQEILESERVYIKKKIKYPFKTDFIYFIKALVNIIFKGARSH